MLSYFFDSDDEYVPSYSVLEQIDKELKEDRKKKEQAKQNIEAERRNAFTAYVNEQFDSDFENLIGLKFIVFRSDKIKFTIKLREITKYVPDDAKCIVRLHHRETFWGIKRSILPVDKREEIYKLFYKDRNFPVTDEDVVDIILEIYNILFNWCKEMARWRTENFKKYLNDEDVILDQLDEELFFTPTQRDLYRKKKEKVLKRMIPPTVRTSPRRRRQRRRVQPIPSPQSSS